MRDALAFRPEIEGLRGIAVLLVMLAHAGVPGLAGGFIGVDMFFVISGYLISGLLEKQFQATGRLDLAAFYARRIKRLLPALLLAMVVTALACRSILDQAQQAPQAQAGYWASLWVSNIHFALSRLDYFDDAAQRNVFIHTWSLGVEEQFYLAWPLFLLLVWRRWRASGHWWIAGVGLASFLCCMAVASRDGNAAYYLMPTRLWQLAAGAWASRLSLRDGRLPILGLGIGVVALFALAENAAYPSAWAILPVASAVLLLQADPARSPVACALLGSAPLRFLGRISYSLYLWHWPMLVLCGHAAPTAGAWASVTALGGSLALATLSERWVERPIRAAGWPPRRVLVGGLFATLALAAMMWFWQASLSAGGALGWVGSQGRVAEANLLAGRISVPEVYRVAGFDDAFESDRFAPYVVVKAEAASGKRVLMAGDSILMQWEPAIAMAARDRGWELVAATKSACPMIDAGYVNERLRRRFGECESWRDALVAFARSNRPDTLILGSASTYPFDDATWVRGTRSFLSKLQAHVGRLVVIAPPPLMPFHPLECVVVHGELVSGTLRADACSAPLAVARQARVAGLLARASSGLPNVTVVSLDEVVCPRGECGAVVAGNLVYRDRNHLNAAFVRAEWPVLSRRLDLAGVR
ncbi:acyltransferase family protein [Thermomonas mangrovi]|uniref:acyltransferase family protein n=1 Tax=Thermomonas mangrovi TaxID=2993316 RepID=UPI0023081E0A|nr:acyltransferase family protein [Thermomonas mangrovi]